MDRKGKRRSDSFNGVNDQLCERCSSIFATVESLRKLATGPGLEHHDANKLRDSARRGCTLCILFYEKLKPRNDLMNKTGPLMLSPIAQPGERTLTTTATSRYPGVIMNTNYLWGRWENLSPNYHFDILSGQENRTKLEFPVEPLSYHLNDERFVAEIQRRLKLCQERHGCSNVSTSVLPTRVIHVGSTTSKRPPHLYVSRNGEQGNYAALSYCWGGPQRVMTTSGNIDSFTKALPVDALPKTIQDALNVTQKLGLRYLWIDAFCILQDDAHDTAKEIDAMGTIYQNATITIAATGAKSVEDGFLREVSRQHSASLAFQLPEKNVTNVVIAENIPDWDDGPLSARAWACQEFYLSSRVILYGSNGEVKWHCHRSKFDPLLPKKVVIETKTARRLRSKQDRFVKRRNYRGSEQASLNKKLRFRCYEQDYPNLIGDQYTKLIISQFLPWCRFIEEYSRQNITKPEDRLPALAGIASCMSASVQDVYLAGTWRSDLVNHLNWTVYGSRPYYWETDFPQPCPTAPSWSWASVNRRVTFDEVKILQAQVVSCHIVPVDEKAPFGQVREGVLTLRASVLELGKDSVGLLSWYERDFEVKMDDGRSPEPDLSEVVFIRLGLRYAFCRDIFGLVIDTDRPDKDPYRLLRQP